MAAQRFADPTMPFHREVHNGCAIGTSIVVHARAYQDQKKSLQLQLNSRNDIALNLVIPLNKPGQLSVNARVNDQYTSEIHKPIHIPLDKQFVLHVRLETHVSEIYLNDTLILDFVHRVNPLEIKEVTIEGPLIISEVSFNPPRGASLEPLPTYDEAAKSVLPEFQNLSLNAMQSTPQYRSAELFPPNISPAGGAHPPPPPSPIAARSGPPPAGTVAPKPGNPLPYPEKGFDGGAPKAPPKKNPPQPSYGFPPPPQGQPIAQVAPQPIPLPISTIPTQNRPAPSHPSQPAAPTGPQGYPPPAQSYPPQVPSQGGYVPPAQYPSAPPTNVYPGPHPPPPSQPAQNPGFYNPYQPNTSYPQQAAYPMYQAGYPQTYVAPTYPMYPYPTVYYDDCHVSSYCYPSYFYDSCHHHHHHC